MTYPPILQIRWVILFACGGGSWRILPAAYLVVVLLVTGLLALLTHSLPAAYLVVILLVGSLPGRNSARGDPPWVNLRAVQGQSWGQFSGFQVEILLVGRPPVDPDRVFDWFLF